MSDRAAGIQPRPSEVTPQDRHASSEPLVIIDESQPGFEASSGTLVGDLDVNDVQLLVAPSSDNSLGENGEDEEEKLELQERTGRPFYRRPSVWWMLGMLPFTSIAFATTIAPRIEIYTKLACEALKPEYQSIGVDDSSIMQIVPAPSKLCGQDPEVQAAVAQLMTFMTVSMGILSCITSGWWGQLSDRYGRMVIIRIAASGLLITDLNFILVTLAAKRLPGGYRFLFVGPAIDGMLGGMTTLMAGLQAYVSDCTPPGARSRVFSLTLGLAYGGMAIGPTLGSLMVRATGDLLSVFYVATGSHIFYTILAFFVIPESLTRVAMRKARKRREALRNDEEVSNEQSSGQPRAMVMKGKMWNYLKKPLVFFAPLSIFLPYRRPEGKGWDYNLTILGSYGFTFQYAQRAFGWDSEIMGYWLSVTGTLRAAHLIIILPAVIKIFTPKASPIQLPISPSEPLHPTRSTSPENSRSMERPLIPKHSPIFDLILARVSIGIEVLCSIGMTIAMSSLSWSAASVLRAFGGGFSPAVQSVALALYESGPNKGIETGKLFGGLSVLQALSSQIIGPSLFGLTYASTVDRFPKAIFVLATGLVACALLFISIVQLPKAPLKLAQDREETAMESEQEPHR
ncbi:major facilitator superfamily domain-containing protein [Gautieria morchelliformis]|nr:major facilitator superfamily domain-containing protein [Gautieria morchelliformis]